MAYRSLYRQYRPRKFSDLKGQDVISRVLKNQLVLGEPAHAYLFSGPRGTGKTSTAKIFATALNCLNPKDGEPCLECENCKEAIADSMIDIIEMDAASNNGVDNARDIRDKAGLLPSKGKYKVYIIDEVHMLTGAAFNALLKTLEEPPEHVVFILATTELEVVPKTVLSRCLRFDFKNIDKSNIVERLKEVLADIGKEAQEEALYEIAEASEGALRDALTILEKCCSYTDYIDTDTVSNVLGRASNNAIKEFLSAFARCEEKESIVSFKSIISSGVETGAFLSQLLESLERILLTKVCGEENDFSEFAERFTKERLISNIETLSDTSNKIKLVSRIDILVEASLLKCMIPLSNTKDDFAAFSNELNRIENKIRTIQEKIIELYKRPVQAVSGEAAVEVKTEKREEKPQKKAPVMTSDAKYFQYLKDELGKEISNLPFISRIIYLGEDDSRIYLQVNDGVTESFLNSQKQELIRLMDAKFSNHKQLDIKYENNNSFNLFSQDGIEIID